MPTAPWRRVLLFAKAKNGERGNTWVSTIYSVGTTQGGRARVHTPTFEPTVIQRVVKEIVLTMVCLRHYKPLAGATRHVHLASLRVQFGTTYATSFQEAREMVLKGKLKEHALSLNVIDRLITWFKSIRSRKGVQRGNKLARTTIGFRLLNRSRFWECCRNPTSGNN